MKGLLEVGAVAKRFGDLVVLDRVTLSLPEGETLALLGPSGSGKTTLLRTIAGFESPDGGTIAVAGEDVTSQSAAERRFGMVFQHYALFPHLSVGDNVAFGLDASVRKGAERSERVAEALELVDLAGFEARRIHQISGGQQQRVALARALAPRPRLLLLDEPLSNLDRTLRERTRREIRATLHKIGITAVWVTHEQDEAFDVGDRVAVLHQGRLEQVGTPEQLYLEPMTRFVAGFVGRASVVRGTWTPEGVSIPTGLGAETLLWAGEAPEPIALSAPVELTFRPEALEFSEPSATSLPVRVVARRYAGSQTFFTVVSRSGERFEVIAERRAVTEGEETSVRPRRDSRPRVFPGTDDRPRR